MKRRNKILVAVSVLMVIAVGIFAGVGVQAASSQDSAFVMISSYCKDYTTLSN